MHIPTPTNNPSGHLPLQFIRTRKERGMGAAVTSGNTEPGSVSKRNIGAPFSRWLQHGESEKVRGHRDEGLLGMDRLRKPLEVLDLPIQVGVIEENSAKI